MEVGFQSEEESGFSGNLPRPIVSCQTVGGERLHGHLAFPGFGIHCIEWFSSSTSGQGV